jgi:hypothetical protein
MSNEGVVEPRGFAAIAWYASAIMSTDAEIARDVAQVGNIGAIPAILRVLAHATNLRISLVARVTDDSWTACAVYDDAGFGLKPGDKLDVATTY